METISRTLLTVLINSLWQVALVAAVSTLCARLMRSAPARFEHVLWVMALGLGVLLPASSALRRESRRSVRSVRSGRPHRAICRRSRIGPWFRRSRAGDRVIPGCGSVRTLASALARFRSGRFYCMRS